MKKRRNWRSWSASRVPYRHARLLPRLIISLLALHTSSVTGIRSRQHNQRILDQIPPPETIPGTTPEASFAPTTSNSPTVSSLAPSSSDSGASLPTTSNIPTKQAGIDFVDGVDSHEPSMAPTLTPQPSQSFPPSTVPTFSSVPTTTARPTVTEVVTNSIPVDLDETCYTTWADLSVAVENATGATVLEVCANSTLVLSPQDAPIEFGSGINATILCGPEGGKLEHQCAIFGGVEHFRIVGSNATVVMKGLTMIASTFAAVHAMGDDTSQIKFQDCEFSGHLGVAAVLNYQANVTGINVTSSASAREGNRNLQVASLAPPDGKSMRVDFESCVFTDNVVTYAPFANLGGDTSVTKTIFSGNQGEVGAVGTWFGGSLGVSTSCFLGNNGNKTGSIFVDESSVIVQQVDNYGDSDNALICNHVSVSDGTGNVTCDSFTANTCLAPRISSNETTDNHTECISEWEIIYALTIEANNEDDLVPIDIEVCPGVTFNMSEYEASGLAPLVITSSNILLQCGSGGKSQNECTLFGGARHIEISSNATNITVQGFAMENATDVSVVITTSTSPDSVVFEDCLWMYNSGEVIMSIEEIATNAPSLAPSVSSSPSAEDVDLGDDVFMDDFFNRDLDESLPLMSLSGVHILRSTFRFNTAAKSVVTNTAENLIVESCEFDTNVVGDSVVATTAGELNMSSCCFHDNEYDATQGVVVSTSSDGFTVTDTFGERNVAVNVLQPPRSGCEGIQSEDGSCTPFDALSCPLLPDESCYASWDALTSSIANATLKQEGGVFTVCEDSNLTVNTNSAPIFIEVSDTVVQCGQFGVGSGLCTISGGEVQFQIIGAPTGVEFRGLTFSNSSGAAVFAAGERSARAALYDCHFNSHQGFAAILNYHGSFPNPGTRVEDVEPPVDRSMQLEIDYCSFTESSVSFAPVTNLRGSVSVRNSVFNSNVGESGGIGVWQGGGMTLVQSCFQGNQGNLSGSAYVDVNSTLTSEEDNYSDNSTVSSGSCSDLVMAGGCESEGVCDGLCVDFNQNTCAAEEPPTQAPSVAPSFQPTPITSDEGCFTDWSRLASAVRRTDFSIGLETVFTVCPDTTLDASLYPDETPIVLSAGDVLFQCGDDGQKENNCTITGGSSHFRIVGAPDRISFLGFYMEGSTDVSIQAMAVASSRVAFEYCEWKGHTGSAVVLVYNEEGGEPYIAQPNIGDLQEPSSESMTATFEFCNFVENEVSFSAIANVGGTLMVFQTLFLMNTGAQAGAISASGGALASVSSSCFVENQSDFPGTIFVSQGSEITTNTDNYGVNNRAGTVGECKDFFQETQGSCFDDLTCGGVCSDFEERSCVISDFDYDVPTFSPTQSPSFGSGGGVVPPSALDGLEFAEKQKFAGTSQFLVTLLLALLIVLGGIGVFVYIRKRGNTRSSDVYAFGPPQAAEPLVGDQDHDNASAIFSQQESSHGNESLFQDEHADDEEDDPFADED